jgi:predicted acetyltransferase
MAVEVRPCTKEEFLAGLTPIFHYFGRVPSEDSITSLSSVLRPERLHAAFEDGRAVGGAGALELPLTVPGGERVPAAGVTTVGVLPTHRRRGILRAMMRAQLDDVHARGEPVAFLWASEGTIYGRFGYGVASLGGSIELGRVHGRYVDGVETPGTVRLLGSTAEALELLPPVYERVAAEIPGMFERTEAWWQTRTLADPEWRRQGGGEQCCALLEIDGEPEAYALYRVNPSFEQGSSTGVTVVIEALGASPGAVASIWRFLLDVDWMQRVRAGLLPVDHPLLLLLAEPRRAEFTIGDALWLRLVDVAAALGARSLRGEDELVLQVTDEFCPWNDGRWRVSPRGTERAESASADLALDVSALACVYLGGFTFRELARAGRVAELTSGGLERADGLFHTDRAPWCPEIF